MAKPIIDKDSIKVNSNPESYEVTAKATLLNGQNVDVALKGKISEKNPLEAEINRVNVGDRQFKPVPAFIVSLDKDGKPVGNAIKDFESLIEYGRARKLNPQTKEFISWIDLKEIINHDQWASADKAKESATVTQNFKIHTPSLKVTAEGTERGVHAKISGTTSCDEKNIPMDFEFTSTNPVKQSVIPFFSPTALIDKFHMKGKTYDIMPPVELKLSEIDDSTIKKLEGLVNNGYADGNGIFSTKKGSKLIDPDVKKPYPTLKYGNMDAAKRQADEALTLSIPNKDEWIRQYGDRQEIKSLATTNKSPNNQDKQL